MGLGTLAKAVSVEHIALASPPYGLVNTNRPPAAECNDESGETMPDRVPEWLGKALDNVREGHAGLTAARLGTAVSYTHLTLPTNREV